MKKSAQREIEISQEELALIMGESFMHYPAIQQNCFCGRCENHLTTIVMVRAYLNDLEDIQLKGQCARCGQRVGRYIETGENPESAAVAKKIRKAALKNKK